MSWLSFINLSEEFACAEVSFGSTTLLFGLSRLRFIKLCEELACAKECQIFVALTGQVRLQIYVGEDLGSNWCPVVLFFWDEHITLLMSFVVRGFEHFIVIRFVLNCVVLFLCLEKACEVVLFLLLLGLWLGSGCLPDHWLRCGLYHWLRLRGRRFFHWLGLSLRLRRN